MKEYLLLLWPQVLLVIPDLVLVLFVSSAVLCRFNKMGRGTSNVIAWQYGALFAGTVCAFIFRFLPDLRDFSPTAGMAGVALFFLLNAKRWSGPRAPEGTEKKPKQTLKRLDSRHLKHVVGGKNERTPL